MAKAKDTIARVNLYRLQGKLDESKVSMPDCYRYSVGTFGAAKAPYVLWIHNPPEDTPAWFGPFASIPVKDVAANASPPKVSYAGFVLLVGTQDATYAAVGGTGYLKLTQACEIEPRFGITIAKRVLRKLDMLAQREVSSNIHTLSRQFRLTYDAKRDVDNIRRILRQVKGGIPKESEAYRKIGSSVSGKDSLLVTGSKSFSKMFALVAAVDELWGADLPSIDIPELEELQPKHHSQLISALDESLAKELSQYTSNTKAEHAPDLFLDHFDIGLLPDRITQYDVVYGKSYPCDNQTTALQKIGELLAAKDPKYPDLTPVEKLQKVSVRMHADDSITTSSIDALKLLCGDIVHQDEVYFRDGRRWFRANQLCREQLDRQLNEVDFIDASEIGLLAWSSDIGEPEYNAAHKGGDTSVLDANLVKIKSQKSGIEFCDLLRVANGEAFLIHVKHGSGAKLRALFAQAGVSSELYERDSEFRQRVHQALLEDDEALSKTDKNRLASLNEIKTRAKVVVFAIYDDGVTHDAEKQALPTTIGQLGKTLSLFAKIDLYNRIRLIHDLGMRAAITRIKPYAVSA